MTATRNGNKWSVNELLALQREYELLELPIQEIAMRHKRTVEAILYKLYNEEIIGDTEVARGYIDYVEQQLTTDSSDELLEPSINYNGFAQPSIFEIDEMNSRISNLESAMNDINQLLEKLVAVSTKKTKRVPLRQQLASCH
jgi:hypothetical protein